MLLIPLLVLLPIYLPLEPDTACTCAARPADRVLLSDEWRRSPAAGCVGLIAGSLVLVVPYRHLMMTRRFGALFGGVVLAVGFIAARGGSHSSNRCCARACAPALATSAHFGVYDFIPQALHLHSVLGLGFNTFSVYYEFVTGRRIGARTFYVALFVETGLVGAALSGSSSSYVFRRLGAARRTWTALGESEIPARRRVRALAYGLTAALVGTMAANASLAVMMT